jgi:flagellar assembly protein FliH
LPSVLKAGGFRIVSGKVVPVGQPSIEQKLAEAPKPKKKNQEERVQEAHDEAEMIILAARNEAQILKDNAKSEALSIRQKAFSDGKQEGYEEGLSEGKAEAQEMLDDAKRALDEAREERKRLLTNLESEVVAFVVKISERLVGNVSKLNPEVIRLVMREALGAMPSKSEAKVMVSKADFEAASKVIKEFSGYGKLSLVEDDSLEPLECLVETPRGSITASLDAQMQGLKEDLLMILKGGE